VLILSKKTFIPIKITLTFIFVFTSQVVSSEMFIDAEASVFKPKYNKVQIPNDAQGDRFDITDIGDDAILAARLTLGWLVADKHELQFVLAPFSYTEEGTIDKAIRFNGATFNADKKIETRYQFSSYRLRYLYHLVNSERWATDIGATLFVRDASIKLSQNGTSTEDEDLGVVPLIALRTTYSFNEQWSLMLDSDLAFAPQGRAIDLALLANYQLDKKWRLSGGYRTIEGGADNDSVYNFAWFNGVTFKVSYNWSIKDIE